MIWDVSLQGSLGKWRLIVNKFSCLQKTSVNAGGDIHLVGKHPKDQSVIYFHKLNHNHSYTIHVMYIYLHEWLFLMGKMAFM